MEALLEVLERIAVAVERQADASEQILASLETTNATLDRLEEELDWAGDLSFAKTVVDRLDGVERAIETLETALA